MVWLIVALAVVVVGFAWFAGQGRLGGMPPLVDDRPGPDLPDSAITSDDLRNVRFAVTARGYSMTQVDALIDRLANQMDGRPYRPVDENVMWQGQTGNDLQQWSPPADGDAAGTQADDVAAASEEASQDDQSEPMIAGAPDDELAPDDGAQLGDAVQSGEESLTA